MFLKSDSIIQGRNMSEYFLHSKNFYKRLGGGDVTFVIDVLLQSLYIGSK